jgi:hypothetical protein
MMSGGAMAQTTITPGNVKFIPGKGANLTYYYTNAETMGGFQMVVSLPEGVTLEEDAEKTAKGLSINGGEAAQATFFDVTVPSGFECIGGKAESDGTTSDGTAYKAGDVILVCFPVKAGAEYKGTQTPSQLCTLTLTVSEGVSDSSLKAVAINGFVGCDTKGTGGAEAAAKYAVSTESVVSPTKILMPDVNSDKKVNGTDIQAVINVIVDEDDVDNADVNRDKKVNGTDIQEIINIIVDEE